ncbi:MAG: hypothetical protein Q9188_000081 [Gyalolechia gomerana]
MLKAQYDASVAQILLAFQTPYFDEYGPTMELKLLGTVGYLTFDPQNTLDLVPVARRSIPLLETEFLRKTDHLQKLVAAPVPTCTILNLDTLCEYADDVIASLFGLSGVVNLQPYFSRFTLATATALIFQQPNSTIHKAGLAAFSKNFDHASMFSALRIRLQELYWLCSPYSYKKACKEFKRVADDLINNALLSKDALRLYPPIPVNVRITKETTWLPKGGGPDGSDPILIRKGAGVGYAIHYTHRLEELYGDDSKEYGPERWEDDRLVNIGRDYLPFSEDFALMEASCMIIKIVQAFPKLRLLSRTPIESLGKEKQNFTVFLYPGDGCKATLR